MTNNLKAKRKQAGRRGGLATLARHGRDHYREIGKKGAQVTHERYHLAPVNLNDFAMVDRKTGKIKAYLSGEKWARPSWEAE